MFAKSEDAKKAGWFSRRHRTNEAHLAVKDARERKREKRRQREATAQRTKLERAERGRDS